MNAGAARDEDDRIRRHDRSQKIAAEILAFEIPPRGVLPGFGGAPSLRGFDAIRIDDGDLRSTIHKIVKGLAYRLDGMLLDGGFRLHCSFVNASGNSSIDGILSQFGTAYEWGPGVRVQYVAAANRSGAISKVELWEKLRFYAVVQKLLV